MITKAIVFGGDRLDSRIIEEINKTREDATEYDAHNKNLSEDDLNRDESKFRIILLVLEKVIVQDQESKTKVSEITNVIRFSNSQIQDELEQRDSKIYIEKLKHRRKEQDNSSSREIDQVNSFLNEVTREVNQKTPSPNILSDLLGEIENLRQKKYETLSIRQIGLLLTIEDFLTSILAKSINEQLIDLSKSTEVKYIGDVLKEGTKYHFNKKCNYWRSLVHKFEEDEDNDDSFSQIIISDDPSIFEENNLKACERCRKLSN